MGVQFKSRGVRVGKHKRSEVPIRLVREANRDLSCNDLVLRKSACSKPTPVVPPDQQLLESDFLTTDKTGCTRMEKKKFRGTPAVSLEAASPRQFRRFYHASLACRRP